MVNFCVVCQKETEEPFICRYCGDILEYEYPSFQTSHLEEGNSPSVSARSIKKWFSGGWIR